MALATRSAGDVAILDLEGRFDAHAAPPVTAWLEQAAARPPAQVLINMSGVQFIDSTALTALVTGMKRCRQNDGDLYLCELRQATQIIFELTRLNRAFEIFSTEAEALARFAA